MRLGIVSAKGSPGATTAGLAIAAVTGGAMVELDPAGGEVECWVGPCGEPGLIRVAAGLRHAAEPDGLIDECAREVCPGVRVVLAPVGGEQASSTLVAIGDRLTAALTTEAGWVVLDGGRWSRTQPSAGRLAGCDVIAVALPPTLAGVAHAAPMVRSLRERTDVRVVGLVVGDRGYTPAELSDALDATVLPAIAWDLRGANALVTHGAGGWWRRSSLARSVRALVESLDTPMSPVASERVAVDA